MAIIKPSEIVSAISGSIGGTTFAASKGSTTMRKKNRVKKKTSKEALAQHARYANAQRTWKNFTDEERTAWRVTAANINFANRLGLPRKLTGFQLFMQQQLPNFGLFPPPTLDAINATKTAPATSMTIDFTSGGAKLVFFTEVNFLNAQFATVYGSRPITTSPVTTFRYWTALGGFITTIPPLILTSQWDAQLGDPAPGERVGVRVVLRHAGSAPAAPLIDSATVV